MASTVPQVWCPKAESAMKAMPPSQREILRSALTGMTTTLPFAARNTTVDLGFDTPFELDVVPAADILPRQPSWPSGREMGSLSRSAGSSGGRNQVETVADPASDLGSVQALEL